MYEYKLLIPKDRVGVLIGNKGKIKRLIEKKTKSKLIISNEEVIINSEDSYNAWICEQVIKAIGRGFNPKDALKLINENYSFEVINIMDYARNENDKIRLKGRVIGSKGSTREYIEETTGCVLNIYGKTISIIGPAEWSRIAREAVIMLLNGSKQSTAYKYIDLQIKKKTLPEIT